MHLASKNGTSRAPYVRYVMRVTDRPKLLVAYYLASIALASTLLSWLEGWSWLDGAWWSQVASLTIGYGDIAPKTVPGRLVAMVFHWLWALYFLLCIAAHFVKMLFRDRNEMTHEEQEWAFDAIERIDQKLNVIMTRQDCIAQKCGAELPPNPFLQPDGTLLSCPPQPRDTSWGDMAEDEPIRATVRH